jgi:uncharacterized protein (TIGR00661 family)
MKILFAIQGTGNGHISRAREIIPHLLNYGQLDVLVSGRQAEVQLPYLIKYKKSGIGYTFGKHGGIDFVDSIQHLSPFRFLADVMSFPVHDYDLIINDFEPITAWACKLKNKPCVALSHQAAFLSKRTPRPIKRNKMSENILKYYAPTSYKIGFHFKPYDSFIHTPIIRKEVRMLEQSNHGHFTVYLPAHADEILIPHLMRVHDVQWHVFSKHSKITYTKHNVTIRPIINDDFLNSLASSEGLVTAGGFESPAEAIYLRKKVLSIPMLNQYEQTCNAEALRQMGISVVKQIDETFTGRLKSWINFGHPVSINYPDETAKIIQQLVSDFASINTDYNLTAQFANR